VAVKSLHEELATVDYHIQRFEQEVLLWSKLHHPNITTIFGVTQDEDGRVFMIMELLQATLAEVIQAAKDSGSYLTLREQTDVSHDCLSGLAYLHELVSAQLLYTI
jgi:serine/threonine protein kinase